MNGIQEVSGSIPLISTTKRKPRHPSWFSFCLYPDRSRLSPPKAQKSEEKTLKSSDFKVFSFSKVEKSQYLQKAPVRLIFDGNFENQEVRYDEENQDEFSRAERGASSKQHQPLHKWPQILSPAVNTASPHFPQTACRLLQINPFRSESRKG